MHGAVHQGENNSSLSMEGRFPVEVVATLEAWGHNISLIDDWAQETGQAQGVLVSPETGVYMGGADPRGDGYVVAY